MGDERKREVIDKLETARKEWIREKVGGSRPNR